MLAADLARLSAKAEALADALDALVPGPGRYTVWMVPTRRAPRSWVERVIGSAPSRQRADEMIRQLNATSEAMAVKNVGRFRFVARPS